jgi:transporter family protein
MLLESMPAVPKTQVEWRRFPKWFWLSVLTIALWGAWGLQSKLIVDRISPWMNQVLFPLGLIPLMLAMLSSKRFVDIRNKRSGSLWALLTGILGGAGNVAFYLALLKGKVSVVAPLTGLFPLVTVAAARLFLKERINRLQMLGLLMAAVAIYFLSL